MMRAVNSSSDHQNRRPINNNRSAVGAAIAIVLIGVAIGAVVWAWPRFINYSLRQMSWETAAGSTIGSIDRFPGDRKRFAWPVRYKPGWKNLYIHGSAITIRDANDLARAAQIEKLNVSCRIEPGALAPLTRLPRLSSLTLSGTGFRAADLRDLRGSTSLSELRLDGCELSKDLFDAIAEITSLERVSISHREVTAEQLEPLTRLPNLRCLFVSELKSTPGLIPIFQRMRHLRGIGMRHYGSPPWIAHELRAAFPELQIVPNPDSGPREGPNGEMLPESTECQWH